MDRKENIDIFSHGIQGHSVKFKGKDFVFEIYLYKAQNLMQDLLDVIKENCTQRFKRSPAN